MTRRAGGPVWSGGVSLRLLGLLIALAPGPIAAQVHTNALGDDVVFVGGTPQYEPNRLPSSGPFTFQEQIKNVSTGGRSVDMSCVQSGPVTCSSVTPATATLTAGQVITLTITYATSATTGSGYAGASVSVNDAGGPNRSRTIVVAASGYASIRLVDTNVANVDRGLCLTLGAGESAGISCGDLFVTASLPAYRTLGKDRSPTLYYNSAAAVGLVLVPARVVEASTIALPTNVIGVLKLAGLKDSFFMAPPAYNSNCTGSPCAPWSDSQQVVFGRSMTGIATGYYPDTLIVTNTYASGPRIDTATGKVLVLNRSASEYGQGWSLLGVEQILTVPGDSTKRIWAAGDGSLRVYSKKLPGDTVFQAAPGDAPDSLIYYTGTGGKWYLRNLKHGASVRFDPTGRHRSTTNRAKAVTTFNWGTVNGQTRLISIVVPPNGTDSLKYTLQWSGTAVFQGITDPTGRQLKATIASGRLTSLIQPGATDTTRFGYDAGGRMTWRSYPRQAHTTLADTAVTRFTYANSARLTKVEVQADSAGAQFQTSYITNWDENGLGALALTTDSLGLTTQYDGPLSGLSDAVTFWVDRFGQPTRSMHLGLGTKTWFYHDSTKTPALVTKVVYPHPTTAGATGRVIRMSWNARGNLTQVKDSTKALDGRGNRTSTYAYDTVSTSLVPDSPKSVTDPMGRVTSFFYDSLGFLEHTLDPRTHITKYAVHGAGLNRGVLDSVVDKSVTTWSQYFGTTSVIDQTVRFRYDSVGNLQVTWDAAGMATGYVNDNVGRALDIYDPAEMRTSYKYDALNRVTQARAVTKPVPNYLIPSALASLSTCNAAQVICTLNEWSQDTIPDSLITNYTQGRVGITQVSDPRAVARTYRRDARALLSSEQDDYGASNISFYSTDGLLQTTTLRTGQVIHFSYDASGRLMSRWFGSVTRNSLTTPGDTTNYTYDLIGRVLTTQNRNAKLIQTYFADGALKSKIIASTSAFAPIDTIRYTYDLGGARTSMYHAIQSNDFNNHNPVRDSLAYGYYSQGDLYTITTFLDLVRGNTAAWATSQTFTFIPDELGRRDSIYYPVRHMVVAYDHDIRGVVRRVVSLPGDPPPASNMHGDILKFSLSDNRDAIGRLTNRVMTCDRAQTWMGSECHTSSSLNENDDYLYNWRNMLTKQQSRLDYVSQWKQYDASGNMVWSKDSGGAYVDLKNFQVATGHNRVLSMADSTSGVPRYPLILMSYDANGAREIDSAHAGGGGAGLDTRSRIQFYDASGRMSGMAWAETNLAFNTTGLNSCQYYPDGQLSNPCGAAPKLAYDGDNVAGIFATRVYQVIQGPGLDDPLMAVGQYPVVGSFPEWRTYYFVTDGQGRLLASSDSTGNLQSNPDNNGTVSGWQYSGGTSNSTSFAAGRMNIPQTPEVSMFRNRAYDSRTGRWLQEDPLGVSGGLNLYQFNGNNPAMYTDPFGLKLDVEAGAQMYVDLCRQKSGTCNANLAKLEKSKIVYHIVELGPKDPLPRGKFSGATSGQVVHNQVEIQIKPSDFAGSEGRIHVKVDGVIVLGHETAHALTVTSAGTGCTDGDPCTLANENIIRAELGPEYGQRQP